MCLLRVGRSSLRACIESEEGKPPGLIRQSERSSSFPCGFGGRLRHEPDGGKRGRGDGRDRSVMGDEQQTFVLGANLTEERVLIRPHEVYVRFVGRIGVRCADLTGERELALLVRCRPFAGIMARRPASLVESHSYGRGRLATGSTIPEPWQQNEVSHPASEERGDGRRGLGRKQVELWLSKCSDFLDIDLTRRSDRLRDPMERTPR